MRAQFVIPVLASILILSIIGLSQNHFVTAQAPEEGCEKLLEVIERLGDKAPDKLKEMVSESCVPMIDPTEGPVGSAFIIIDPLGRMQAGQQALFYPLGGDPDLQGVNADNITISSDGTILTGNVPFFITGGEKSISVRPLGGSSIFADLQFTITGLGCPPNCPE